MRILHRHILKEMLKALALALGAVSGLVCIALVLGKLQSQGLGPVASLQYMGLSVPGAVYLALPLAAVLAATLVYGRLASDRELMACQASGIPVSSLLWPAVLLAIFAGLVSLALAAWPLSESKYAAKCLALSDIERLFFSKLSDGRITVRERGFQMTVDRVEGHNLAGPTVKYLSQNGQTYCYAPLGQVEFDKEAGEATLKLWDALVVDELHANPMRGDHKVGVPLPKDVPRGEDDLSLWQLMFVQSHPEMSDEVKAARERFPEAVVELRKGKVRASATAELHGRLATALGCVGLVLIGAGLGVYFHSGHLLTAFGVSLIPWAFSFFLTMMVGVKTVSNAVKDPQRWVWTIWAPDVAVVILGLAVLGGLMWIWAHPIRLRHRLIGWRPPVSLRAEAAAMAARAGERRPG
jgi:lipopolysaccharide export LptBFGC system permease protein LptF